MLLTVFRKTSQHDQRQIDRVVRAQKLYDLSWAILVRKSAGAVEGVEGLAQVVGDGVGSADRLPSGLDLDGAVAAGGLDEFPDRPAGSRFDPPGDLLNLLERWFAELTTS